MNERRRAIPVLLVEDSDERTTWFELALPVGFRLVRARSAGVALQVLRLDAGHTYGAVLLDHDLQDRAITAADRGLSGTQVTAAVVQWISPDVPVLVHSANPEKAAGMVGRLQGAGFDVSRVPFRDLTSAWLREWLEEAVELWEDAREG